LRRNRFDVLDEIVNNETLRNRYLKSFREGDVLFLEGDESQDLYILLSGHLEVFKGDKKISEITDPGSVFGEASSLLGGKRTATVKAEETVQVLRIPKTEVDHFLADFPSAAQKMGQLLAKRLDEASQIVYGFRQICDKLPDAVLLSDRDGKILAWNLAAEKLYGRDWHQMKTGTVEDIYEEPRAYKDFLEDVQSQMSVSERVLKIRHPEKGTRFVSTSTSILLDGQHNFQGVLSIGRDVTSFQKMEQRYRRARLWIIPALVLLLLLGGAVFLGYPYFSRGVQTMDLRKQELRNLLAKDFLLLKSLLGEPLSARNREKTREVMKDFFDVQVTKACPYSGLVLLDREKKVFDSFSIKPGAEAGALIGNSYVSIPFQGSEESLFRILVLYRADKQHPMGQKGIEIAFEMEKDGRSLGWLVFQMDMKCLEDNYEIDEEGLKRLQA
jgi:PAS domain S-box-containing protein